MQKSRQSSFEKLDVHGKNPENALKIEIREIELASLQ